MITELPDESSNLSPFIAPDCAGAYLSPAGEIPALWDIVYLTTNSKHWKTRPLHDFPQVRLLPSSKLNPLNAVRLRD